MTLKTETKGFIEAKRKVERELLKKKGVHGVYVGKKKVNGKQIDRIAIVVCVSQKLPRNVLKAEELVPDAVYLNSIRFVTDVVEVPKFAALGVKAVSSNRTGKWRPAPGGVSIGHKDISAGSLGVWLKDRDEKWVILTNNHIAANSNDALIGDFILQPGPYDNGVLSDAIAKLKRFIPITFVENSGCPVSKTVANILNFLGKLLGSGVSFQTRREDLTNQVDCAVAEVLDEDDVKNSILGIAATWQGVIGDVALDDSVLKSGRTTAVTYGKITGLDATLTIDYGDNKTAIFDQQILSDIESAGGDSGSCVFKDDGNVLIGLLFAGGEGMTVLNPIHLVFDRLELG